MDSLPFLDEHTSPATQHDSPDCKSVDYLTQEEKAEVNIKTQSSESEQDDLERFNGVMQAIQLDELSELVLRIKKSRDEQDTNLNESSISPASVASTPLTGSYHILLPVDFADGTRWLLKVPGAGTSEMWDISAANALTSEALTMQLLKRKSIIPIPEVYDFNAQTNNELGVPYILMDYINGFSLYSVWFDKSKGEEELESIRTTTLSDIAMAMAALSEFTFEQGGSLRFDDRGEPWGTGPQRVPDNLIDLPCVKSAESDNDEEYDNDVDDDECPAARVFHSQGPFHDHDSYYNASLRRWPPSTESGPQRDLALLTLFLSWIPRSRDSSTTPAFVLAHPDFDIQNVIVDKAGHVLALIDWDGVAAVPWSVGALSYPAWLTRDWDPMMYNSRSGLDGDPYPEGCAEDSRGTLAHYRQTYVDLIERAVENRAAIKGAVSLADEKASMTTRRSIVYENLCIAASNPITTCGILENLFYKIVEASDNERALELDYDDVAQGVLRGDLEDEVVGMLRDGFWKLLEHHGGTS